MTKPCLALAAAVCLAAVLALPVVADEIWIAPGEKADLTVGDWGVTATGEAHFTFAVPPSLDQFVGAQVMLIGKKNKAVTYELHLSISQDGANQAAFNADATGLPLTISTDKLSAADASSLFPTALAAGVDLVGLYFKATSAADMRVIGLRFQFTRIPDQAGLTCGAGEFLVGFDAAGAPICDDRSRLLANLACPAGEFVTGFDANGDLVCSPGGTGGGGSGTENLIAINDVEQAEGNSGTTPMVFTVSLAEPSTSTVTVNWSTRTVAPGPGVADPGTDFVAASGTVTFAPGVTTQPVTIDIVGDTTPEFTEEFFVDLSNPTGGAAIGDGEGRGRIFDDDNDGR
jgi:hypothetical protein